MTNERHEKALEAAYVAALTFQGTSNTKEIETAIDAYLQAMDAVIVPKEPTVAMYVSAGDALVPSADAQACWHAMLSKAPNHFTNGE